MSHSVLKRYYNIYHIQNYTHKHILHNTSLGKLRAKSCKKREKTEKEMQERGKPNREKEERRVQVRVRTDWLTCG